MKKYITLLFLFFVSIAFSQVQKLGALSSGQFLDSAIIYEENGEDVWGYLLAYKIDKKSREVYELEYVVLDKNLNKLTSAKFLEGMFDTLLLKFKIELTFVKKIKNQLIIGINDKANNTELAARVYINHRFRTLNLDTFAFSKEFVLEDFKMIDRDYATGTNTTIDDFWNVQQLIKTKGNYLFGFATPAYNPKAVAYVSEQRHKDKITKSIKSFAVLDEKMNIVWKKEINAGDSKIFDEYSYFDSDTDVLLLQKYRHGTKDKEPRSIEIYNLHNGDLIGEMPFLDAKYLIFPDRAEFTKDKVAFYVQLYDNKKMLYEEVVGFSKVIFDKKTGKELNRDHFLWENFKPHLQITNKYGEYDKYGKILPQDFVLLENGNTLIVAEGYKSKRSSEILDLFMVELLPDMSIKYFKKIDKNKISLQNINAAGIELRQYGYFDFLYKQKLNNREEYVFFYANNEREGSKYERRKNPSWVLGIITFVDGEFNYDKLQLTKKASQIIPGKAKKGYVRLIEVGSDDVEMRLEKVNY